MEPGPPWPPAGTARAMGGGSSVAKSINGLPGLAGTPVNNAGVICDIASWLNHQGVIQRSVHAFSQTS